MANIYILTVMLAVCSIGVQAQDVACGAALHASTTPEVITSANFPDDYDRGMDCTNVITASDPSQTIVLDISAFDVEYHSDCNYDYLEVFDGQDSSSVSLGKFCGNFTEDSEDSPPRVIESSGDALTLFFHSDYYVEGSGYSATYQAVQAAGPWTAIDDAFEHIRLDGSELFIEDWAEGRLDAYGNIDQSVYPQTGTVNFPDHREFQFYYYPDEAIIYWDADKGNTNTIWYGEHSGGETDVADCWNQYDNAKYGGTKLAQVYNSDDAVSVCEALGCVAYTCHEKPEKKGCSVYSEISGEIAKNGRSKKWTSFVYGPCETEPVEKRDSPPPS